MSAAAPIPNAWQCLLQTEAACPPAGYRHLERPAAELEAAQAHRLVAELSELGVLRVRGADARAFLRRILSNPVTADAEHAEFGALCQSNGRVIANFILYAWQDCLHLLLSLDLMETVSRELGKYVLASRVVIEPAQAETARMGLAGEDAAAVLERHCGTLPAEAMHVRPHPEYTLIRLPGEKPWFVLCGQPQALGVLWQAARDHGLQAGAGEAWRLLEIMHRLARISATASGRHLPQALELERLGGLDFNKGCYPGQEVIVRLRHRGRLKRGLYTVCSQRLPLEAGAPILRETDGAPAGEIVHAASLPQGGSLALAVLLIESANQPLVCNDGAHRHAILRADTSGH